MNNVEYSEIRNKKGVYFYCEKEGKKIFLHVKRCYVCQKYFRLLSISDKNIDSRYCNDHCADMYRLNIVLRNSRFGK